MIVRSATRTSRGAWLAAVGAAAALTLAACGGSDSGSGTTTQPSAGGSGAAAEKYTIYFTNNFADNDWRQQMQKTVELAVQLPEYKDQVELKVSNSDVAPTAQSAMIDNIIQQGDADAIIMEAASPDAVNPAIQRACDAGIKVVTFDSTASAPCAWKVSVDWKYNGMVTAAFVSEQLGGNGKVAVDYGLKGLEIGKAFVEGVTEEMAKYPGIEIVGQYEGGFNPGQEQSGTAALLASHPDLAASMTMYVGSSAGEAFKAAGSPSYIYVGTGNNDGHVKCLADPNAKCIFWDDSSGISVLALQTALDALNGKLTEPSAIIMNAPDGVFFVKGADSVKAYPNAKLNQLEEGVNAFPNLPASLVVPILPDQFANLAITPEDLTS